jgi:uncharacterized repeat protein (TIGR01451 family)
MRCGKAVLAAAMGLGGLGFAAVAAAPAQAASAGVASPDPVVVTTADLSVSKVGSGSVRAGSDTTYTMTVANNGPDAATGVTLTDKLPADVTFVSASPSAANCVPGTGSTVVVTCAIGNLASGSSVPVYITVHVSDRATGLLINSATVAGDQTDPNKANNSATLGSTVNPAIHDGKDGRDGKDGHEGRDGHDGKDGKPGRDGKDGHEGRDGHDGRSEDRNHHGCDVDSPEFPFCQP